MLSKKEAYRLTPTTIKQHSIFRGLILASISGVCFSIVALIVKQMKNLHPGQLALYNFISTFVMLIPETVKSGQNPLGPPKFRFHFALRGIFGGLNIFFNFIAFQYLGLGEASVIIFSSPAFVSIFARIFFKEPCNIFQSIAVVLTVIGIIFTSKLPSRFTEMPVVYSSDRTYGFLAAIFSMFSVSAVHLITRRIRIVHQSVMNLHYSWIGTLEIAFLTAIFGNFQWPQCGLQRMYILLLALFSYGGLTLLVMALKCDYAGPVATVRAAADIIMAFLWQIFIFHDVPDFYDIVGAALVSVSIILIGIGKWLRC